METLFEPINNEQEGLSQRIAAELRQRILAGQYKPGTRIRQEELAESFGTSRIPVREALWQLETEGLVVLIRNTGAWIAKLDLADCIEVYKIRERIEPLALAESIVNLKDADIASLSQLVAEIERNLEVLSPASLTVASTSALDNFLRQDREFHLLCYRGAKMPRLTSMIERFWNTTQQYRRANSTVMRPGGHKIVSYEHRLLLDAIARRDVETAAHVLADHIRRTRLHLQEHKELF